MNDTRAKVAVIQDDAFCDLEAIRLDLHTAVDAFVDEYQVRVRQVMARHLRDRRRARLLPTLPLVAA